MQNQIGRPVPLVNMQTPMRLEANVYQDGRWELGNIFQSSVTVV